MGASPTLANVLRTTVIPWRETADAKLPEGRLIVPFNTDFGTLTQQTLNKLGPFIAQTPCSAFDVDFSSILTVAQISCVRAVQFTLFDFLSFNASTQISNFGNLYLYFPSTEQFYSFTVEPLYYGPNAVGNIFLSMSMNVLVPVLGQPPNAIGRFYKSPNVTVTSTGASYTQPTGMISGQFYNWDVPAVAPLIDIRCSALNCPAAIGSNLPIVRPPAPPSIPGISGGGQR